MRRSKWTALVLIALGWPVAYAQNASYVSSGTAFANSIAPKSASQIVNPSAVNAGAWGSQTGVASAVPSGLGGFSNPNTTTNALSQARGSSLSSFGRQAEANCASYTPGSDPYQNQYCAAVNFLNDQCMTPTSGQKSVLGKTASSFGTASNCAGSYGAGQSQFNYGNQVTPSDPIFQVIGGLANSATSTLTQTCTNQQVVTKPAQYANNTCVVSDDEEDNACSQYLSATVVNTVNGASSSEACASGTLQNGVCLEQLVYPPQLTCPAGYVMTANNTCVQTSTLGGGPPSCPGGWQSLVTQQPAGLLLCIMPGSYPTCPDTADGMPLALAYLFQCYYTPPPSCPAGYTWNGSACTQTITVGTTYSCPSGGSLQGQSCVTTTTTTPTTTYSCPPGETLSGTNCIKKSVTTTWTDSCTPYEQSSGVSLATPAN